MDNDKAREELTKLRDSLNEVLGTGRSNISKADAEKAVVEAKKGVKRLRKSLLERVKDLPIINQATQLGAAGSVAVATAAVTQTNIAVQETEVFVASVANDVVEERFIPPSVFNRFVDFPELNDWGQKVMQKRFSRNLNKHFLRFLCERQHPCSLASTHHNSFHSAISCLMVFSIDSACFLISFSFSPSTITLTLFSVPE